MLAQSCRGDSEPVESRNRLGGAKKHVDQTGSLLQNIRSSNEEDVQSVSVSIWYDQRHSVEEQLLGTSIKSGRIPR